MLEKLKEKIIKANESYRIGSPIITDSEFDILLDELRELSPDDDLLEKVGHVIVDDSRKARLPITMASMNKIKSFQDIKDWFRLKEIPLDTVLVITPKFDGLSLLCDEFSGDCFTRGDGVFGQKSNEHYKLIGNHLGKQVDVNYTCGEVIMPKKTFLDKYSLDFANPRNLVAGLLNSKEPSEMLKDCVYIKYGGFGSKFKTKHEILDFLNSNQEVGVKYHLSTLNELSEDLLIELFHKYSEEFEIDGLILEVDSMSLQEKLGRETSSNNPCFARAFKHNSFEQTAETEILNISWNISKNGLLKPVAQVKPVKLDGVVVSNVTCNNARFVKDMGLGKGAKIILKRSGMVIPFIVEVLETVDFVLPEIEDVEIVWNENMVELITIGETDEQLIKKNISFFEILGAENCGPGIIRQLWDSGFKTIKQILELSKSDLESLDGFGKRKASIVYDAIQKSIKDVELSKLQHATGIFGTGLGSKKLKQLEHFKTKPSVNQVLEIDGFADITATNYVENYDLFFEFIKNLPITIAEKVEVVGGGDLDGKVFVFTGVRMKNLEEIIESRSGKIGSSVSKNTTHLVMKAKGSGSSKETKAIQLGIEILTVEELEELLK